METVAGGLQRQRQRRGNMQLGGNQQGQRNLPLDDDDGLFQNTLKVFQIILSILILVFILPAYFGVKNIKTHYMNLLSEKEKTIVTGYYRFSIGILLAYVFFIVFFALFEFTGQYNGVYGWFNTYFVLVLIVTISGPALFFIYGGMATFEDIRDRLRSEGIPKEKYDIIQYCLYVNWVLIIILGVIFTIVFGSAGASGVGTSLFINR